MEIRKIKLYEITYKNNTHGEYFKTMAYNTNFLRIMLEYRVELSQSKDLSLEFKVKEVEYEYIHKENKDDIVYYTNGIACEKYESLEELLKNNNFGEGLFEIYNYDSSINCSFILDFYDDFQTDRVITKKTLNTFTINANGINITIDNHENGFSKKLN